ncbi:MAG: ribose-phosphate diphosphokinase [Candidatus Hermodarchaeota archaeon]
MVLVTSGSPSKTLAWKVAQQLGAKFFDTEIKCFPDGETYVRFLGEVAKEDVVVVQSLGHQPNHYLVELFLMLDALKDLKAKRVIAVLPYFAYARQDERFKPGEAISLKTVSRLIEAAGADYIFTIDSHRHRVVDQDDLTKVPLEDLTAMAELAEHVNSKYELTNPAVIGPDAEAGAWAKIAADALSVDYDALEKKRFDAKTVEIKPRHLELKGRDVLIVDDIISTGNTIIKAIDVLKKNGANDIYVACTHPLLVLNALVRIYQAGALDVVGTDTVSSAISHVSVAPVIVNAIKKIK